MERCVLASFLAKQDYHACTHMRRFLASIWPFDMSGKNPEKSSKISDKMWNIIRNNQSNLNEFDLEKDSPKYGEMRCFIAHVQETLLISNFSPPQII